METLAPRFLAETGVALHTTFGAVGAIREKLLANERFDALILTEAMIQGIEQQRLPLIGHQALRWAGCAPASVFVRATTCRTSRDRAALQRTLCAATDIYVPDLHRSTAGLHFARVLEQLGIHAEISPRLRPHPNGATAMRELAQSIGTTPIGCTQVTEILYTSRSDAGRATAI